ncbi:MAG: hypothetical protein U0324_23505 [Polyangiales bacterium]
MSDARDTPESWLASTLRAELPLTEGPYALALTGTSCDGAHVAASLRLTSPPRPEDPPYEPPPPHARELALLDVAHAANRARAGAFVRAWAASVRRALHDLTTSPLPDPPWFGPMDLGNPAALAATLHDAALVTYEDFLGAFAARKHLGRFFALTADVAGAALALVHEVVTERPPFVETDRILLRALTTPWNDDPPPGPSRGGVRVRYGGVVAAFELSVLAGGTARDSKQQELELVGAEHLDDLPRVEAYLRAWRDVLPEHASLFTVDDLELVMPHDLVLPDVLSLKRARRREDFLRAFAKRWSFDARRHAAKRR